MPSCVDIIEKLDLVGLMKDYKTRSCIPGPPGPIPHLVLWVPDSEEKPSLIAFMEPTTVLPAIIRGLRDKFPPPSCVVFMSDAYMNMIPKGEDGEIPHLERGALQQRFESGDMTVQESLVMSARTRNDGAMIMIPYTIDDNGQVNYEESQQEVYREGDDEVASVGGLVFDSLAEAFNGR
jgi:hypothetical protein